MYTFAQSARLARETDGAPADLSTNHDVDGETTPAWMVAKNVGVTLPDVIDRLRARGVEIVVDRDCKPAVRKRDLLDLISR